VAGAHDGYQGLRGGPIHRRTWRLEAGRLAIEDRVDGRHAGATAVFHFHPDMRLVERDGAQAVTFQGRAGTRVALTSSSALVAAPSTWHPRFGQSLPSSKVSAAFSGGSLATSIGWS
jgi:hypothetical protein